MKSKIGRITLIVLGTLIVLAVLFGFLTRFGMNGYNYPFRSGMMGSWGFMHSFSFFGMAFMWLLPIGIIILFELGIISLFNGSNKSNQQPPEESSSTRVCPHCGKNSQNDWNTCPYCGEKI